MVDVAFLRQVEVFENLNDGQLKAIQQCCEEQDFQAGDKLFSEKEPASHLWLLKEGCVDLRFDLPGRPTSTENTISTIGENMLIGWSSLVPPFRYTLSAYCTSRVCKVVKMEKERLMKLFESDPRIGYLVLSYLIRVVGSRFQLMQHSPAATPYSAVKITVHMGTCGIAAGSREVMTALMDEINRSNRKDIQVESGGCLGECTLEPNVTVQIGGAKPVLYANMDPEKMRTVFSKHIVGGEVVTELT